MCWREDSRKTNERCNDRETAKMRSRKKRCQEKGRATGDGKSEGWQATMAGMNERMDNRAMGLSGLLRESAQQGQRGEPKAGVMKTEKLRQKK